MKKFYYIVLGLFLFGQSAVTLAEDKMDILGTYDDWTAYVYHDPNGKICYITTTPTKSQGKYTKRGDIFLYVTHNSGAAKYDVVDAVTGYTYKKGSKPTIQIDKNKAITLVPVSDTAWAKDAATDTKLVAQMKKGSTAVLKGTSTRGTLTTDTFSLKGFSKAYQSIQKACGRE